MPTIIAAIISAAAAIAVCIISNQANHKKLLIENNANHKKLLAELDKRDALQAYRIEQLEKKVDKHNQIVERTYHLEQANAVIHEQIKAASRRIDDLEKKDIA